MTAFDHIPVMVDEVLEYLQPRPGGIYVDGTVGYGGHAVAIGKRIGTGGLLIGLDLDPQALDAAGRKLTEEGIRHQLIRGNFADLEQHLAKSGVGPVDGVLLDLGVSSPQLDEESRGFSFRGDAELDCRMDPDQPLTAADLVNTLSESELADLLWREADEKYANRIARAIVEQRDRHPIRRADELVQVVVRAYPKRQRHGPRHVCTKTLLGLRIATNSEQANLQRGLPAGLAQLRIGGRMVVLTWHGGEDRVVKRFFRACAHTRWASEEIVVPPGVAVRLLTKKPLQPGEPEIGRNRRARSCKLRAVERVQVGGSA